MPILSLDTVVLMYAQAETRKLNGHLSMLSHKTIFEFANPSATVKKFGNAAGRLYILWCRSENLDIDSGSGMPAGAPIVLLVVRIQFLDPLPRI